MLFSLMRYVFYYVLNVVSRKLFLPLSLSLSVSEFRPLLLLSTTIHVGNSLEVCQGWKQDAICYIALLR